MEIFFVILLVGLAVLLLVRQIFRTVKGKGGGCGCSCACGDEQSSCCGDTGKPKRQNDGGCGSSSECGDAQSSCCSDGGKAKPENGGNGKH